MVRGEGQGNVPEANAFAILSGITSVWTDQLIDWCNTDIMIIKLLKGIIRCVARNNCVSADEQDLIICGLVRKNLTQTPITLQYSSKTRRKSTNMY